MHTISFFAFRVYQNKTGFEKGKATLSKSGYIILRTDGNRDCGGGNYLGIADLAEDLDKAIELNPNNAKAYNIRGVTWLHFRNLNNARLDLTIARYMGVDIIAIFREVQEIMLRNNLSRNMM